MRGEAEAIASTLLTPCAVSRMAWIRIGFLQLMPGFELRQQLVEVVDVPRPVDLGQHDHVKLAAGRRDDLGDVVERPGRIEGVDARPQPGRTEIGRPRHCDETVACRLFGIDRNGVFEIAQHDVDLANEFRHFRAHFLDVRRYEMDHALKPHRQFAQRRWSADGERGIELARQFHRHPQNPVCRLEECKGCAKCR